jgi:hypothetical protein
MVAKAGVTKTKKRKSVQADGSVKVIAPPKQRKILLALAHAQQITRELQLARCVDNRSLHEQVTL